MRKILVTVFLFFALTLCDNPARYGPLSRLSAGTLPACAVSLQGGVSENIINKGFFGVWHVTTKLVESNSSSEFAQLSVHIWNLSGYGNVLVLENQFSGAKSEITVDKAVDNIDGALLKFKRVSSQGTGDGKIVLTEMPEITLKGDIFQGSDTFIIEKYNNGALYKKEVVKYKIVGQRITRETAK